VSNCGGDDEVLKVCSILHLSLRPWQIIFRQKHA